MILEFATLVLCLFKAVLFIYVCFDLVSTESGHPAQFVSVNQGSRLWEHNKAPQYALSPSWPYRMPQNYIQQGNGGYQPGKPFVAQGQTWWTLFSLLLRKLNHKLSVCTDFGFCLSVLSSGSVVHPNPNFPLVPHVRHQVNLNFIQQKKWNSRLASF